uniref:WAP domain-containing protein n=1 Tax=Anas platyrhynchos platyrhynchos TaxID=8840 RepID=A0A493T8I4_ANAPP
MRRLQARSPALPSDLPQARLFPPGAPTGRSSLASPHPAGFKSRLAGRSSTAPPSIMMPGAGTLVLVLLALCVELPPSPAQQPRAGDHGAAPTAGPLPRRAPRGRRLPATLPAPGKAGECPAAGSSPPRPSRLYCLSDHSCPGAEKCCRHGDVRACLLPATESPGYCPRAGPSGASCGASCSNDTACGPAEKCCTHSCCARCLPAQPAKPGLCPRKRARRGTAACPSHCADDRDCPGDHKCCFSGCGLACTSPHTGTPPDPLLGVNAPCTPVHPPAGPAAPWLRAGGARLLPSATAYPGSASVRVRPRPSVPPRSRPTGQQRAGLAPGWDGGQDGGAGWAPRLWPHHGHGWARCSGTLSCSKARCVPRGAAGLPGALPGAV